MSWYRLVGTSHVATQSAKLVKQAFEEFQPNVVAIELDRNRLQALLEERATKGKRKRSSFFALSRVVGVKAALFALIAGMLQRKLATKMDLVPGAEMLVGHDEARRRRLPLLLADQDLRITLHRLNNAMGWPEFKQFLKDFWCSIFKRETVQFDLRDVPDDKVVEQLLTMVRQRYPRPYKVLVSERNAHMARVLLAHHRVAPDDKILVVIGAGHGAGLRALLETATQTL